MINGTKNLFSSTSQLLEYQVKLLCLIIKFCKLIVQKISAKIIERNKKNLITEVLTLNEV